MKRQGNILICMLLSLMVVAGGAGFVIVKCCCKGNMTKTECRSKCCTQHGKHHIAAKPCAETIVMKLWPSATGLQKQAYVPDAPAMMLPPYQSVMYGHIPVTAYFISRYAARLLHAPPRLYLAMIRVLII
ncbi:hypothetical protein [Prevotella sp.]|uniref:hypothetical protein n=1 Tax=Prevotella sp. TaxID=59823 RepID=UPI003AB528AE